LRLGILNAAVQSTNDRLGFALRIKEAKCRNTNDIWLTPVEAHR
jgi:hypothetical protein